MLSFGMPVCTLLVRTPAPRRGHHAQPLGFLAQARWRPAGFARTLENIGTHFGVTRKRIRQIEAEALRKLRHPSRARRLRVFLEE